MSHVVTPTLLNSFLSIDKWGKQGFRDMLLMRPIENTYYIDKGNKLESMLIGGEIPKDERIGIFQVYGEKPFRNWVVRGFADILGFDDIIYDIKYRENYKDISFYDSTQHIIYAHLFDCNQFKYLIWDKSVDMDKLTYKDIYKPMYEEQYTIGESDYNRLAGVIDEFFSYILKDRLLQVMHDVFTNTSKLSDAVDYSRCIERFIGLNAIDMVQDVDKALLKRSLKSGVLFVDDEGEIKEGKNYDIP